jgi:hypothetical protein
MARRATSRRATTKRRKKVLVFRLRALYRATVHSSDIDLVLRLRCRRDGGGQLVDTFLALVACDDGQLILWLQHTQDRFLAATFWFRQRVCVRPACDK